MDYEHTEDDPGQTIYVLKCSFKQSVEQLFSVDNLNTTFSNQFYLPQKVNDATRRTN